MNISPSLYNYCVAEHYFLYVEATACFVVHSWKSSTNRICRNEILEPAVRLNLAAAEWHLFLIFRARPGA